MNQSFFFAIGKVKTLLIALWSKMNLDPKKKHGFLTWASSYFLWSIMLIVITYPLTMLTYNVLKGVDPGTILGLILSITGIMYASIGLLSLLYVCIFLIGLLFCTPLLVFKEKNSKT